MLKKKSVKSPAEQDFKELDSAVSELSKQTEALLGSFESEAKQEKPKMPKKHATVSRRGKSFDIIHDPKQNTKLPATLKTAVSDSKINVPVAAIVSTHKEGSLQPLIASDVARSTNAVTASTARNIEPIEAEEEHNEPKAELKLPAKESLTFAEEEGPKEPAPEDSTTSSKEKPDLKEAEKVSTPEEDSSVESEESGSYHGELYANNLVKEAEPKGYKAKAGTESKPVIFDTEEYHPELHDWSKLEHRSGSRWLVLFVAVLIFAAAAYIFVSGTKLPLNI